MKTPREFAQRLFRTAFRAERERVSVETARKLRPAYAFSVAEGVLGLVTLASGARRKSWFAYVMGVLLLGVSCGHAFLDIREQKILDLLSEKLS